MHQHGNSPTRNHEGPGKSIVDLLARQDSAQIQSIWPNDRLCEYFLASDSRRHTWHAWLAARGTAIRDVPETYRFLTFAKSRQILTDACGNCPPGMISALGKFGPYARTKSVYVALHQVLSAGGLLARHVHQWSKFGDDDLVALASGSSLPVSSRVVRALLKRKMPTQATVELLWVISRLAPVHGEQQLVQCTAHGRQPAAILANLFSLTPFPEPPFEQVCALIPITTAEQLRKTGEEFGNCLKGGEELAYALSSVQAGQRYFYRWNGDQPMLLSFSRCGSRGWILEERSGPRNARVPEDMLNHIVGALAAVPNVFVGRGGAGMLEWMCAR